jgi:ABC-type nitrate/sulfonate/bicarbonate transport system substrate-binding protein
MTDKTHIKFVHRSRSIQYPMLAAVGASGAWGTVGIDPGDELDYVSDANKADQMLMNGEIDFILGSHVTPYLRYDEGVPFVYLGQTVNLSDDAVLSQRPISGVEDLRGLRIADRLDRAHHAHGNHILELRRAGIAEDEVEWVDTKADPYEVLSGDIADAVFVGTPDTRRAEGTGVFVHIPAPLPMVNGSTMTTLWPNVEKNPELFKNALKALRLGISFFIDEPEKMKAVMADDVAHAMNIKDQSDLDALYVRNAGLLERTLYPNNEAVTNAFELAVLQRPELRDRISPLALWDVHFLRELDAEA